MRRSRSAQRWAILAILVPPASAAAGPLLKGYAVNVHMKKISPAAMRDVRNAVRADVRRASASGFFETLSAEPLYPDGDGHIMDRSPDRFGWCVAFPPRSSGVVRSGFPRAIACRRNPYGRRVFRRRRGPWAELRHQWVLPRSAT